MRRNSGCSDTLPDSLSFPQQLMKLWILLTFLVGMVSTLAKPAQESLVVGSRAPDFDLESIDGSKIKPVDKNQTTVLVFSRAHWCPFCLKQLLELRRNVKKLEAANARVVVVFREEAKGIDGLKIMKKRAKVDFTFAIDNDKQQTASYSPGDKEYSTYVINKSGRIEGIIKGDTKNRAKSQRILDTIAGLESSFKAAKILNKPSKISIFRFFDAKSLFSSENLH